MDSVYVWRGGGMVCSPYISVCQPSAACLLKYDDDRIAVFSSISTVLRPALVVV